MNVDTAKESPTVLSLCSGYGGIEEGLRRVFGEITVLAHVEIEAFAIANLVNKMETGRMVPVPVWTDLKTFNAGIFRGSVDILSGGYPCQPFSAAGKRKGADDPRHLWPFIADIVRECEPSWCFFENVEGHLSLGVSEVLADLEEMGYRAAAGIFSAAEVGAPHQRKRVFILAHRAGTGLQTLWDQPITERREGSSGESGELALSNDQGCKRAQRGGAPRTQGQSVRHVAECNLQLAHRISERLEGHVGYEQDTPGQEGSWPSRSVSSECLPSLWPARPGQPQYEWEEPRVVANQHGNGCHEGRKRESETGSDGTIGENGGQIKPQLGRAPDGSTDRVDRLRLLGNGVVPQTVEKAWRTLCVKLLTDYAPQRPA